MACADFRVLRAPFHDHFLSEGKFSKFYLLILPIEWVHPSILWILPFPHGSHYFRVVSLPEVIEGVAIWSQGELFKLFQICCQCFQSTKGNVEKWLTKRLSCIFNERKLLRFICFLGPLETFRFSVSVSWRTLAVAGMDMLSSRGKKASFTFSWALIRDYSWCLCGFSILLLPFIIFDFIKLLGWPRFPLVRLAIILKFIFVFCLCGL